MTPTIEILERVNRNSQKIRMKCLQNYTDICFVQIFTM